MNPKHNGSSRRQTPTQDTPVYQDVNESVRLRDEEQAPVGERPRDFAPVSSKAAYYRKWSLILLAGLLVTFGLSAVSHLWEARSDSINESTIPGEVISP
ncbi:MAG TPA: hypothetical protein V6D29_09170 [Leptolyngbyaceae cyanobacterium]